MSSLAWLLPALPALAAVIGFLAVRWIPGGPAVPALVGSVAALVVACLALGHVIGDPDARQVVSTAWTPIGGTTLTVGTYLNGLAAVVAVMVAVVALLVQLYSTAYMAGDPRYGTYAAEVSLFTAAMLLVVVASSLFELLIGWEVMGLCSYLLIGHYWQSEGARDAAVKAFVTTRIGDTGFLIGIFVLGVGGGTFDIRTLNASLPIGPGGRTFVIIGSLPPLIANNLVKPVHVLGHTALVVGLLLLLMGVIGKSAQFPLHVWLPDAMAGPTPISALIHAATMVAAGIYLVARMYPLFLAAPVTLTVLGVIACITMLGAALAALAQDDLKRVLAWSTCSQLAYMLAGLSVRGWTAGIYALLAHAAYKALLFLAAGSVLRSVGTNLMSEMGGLWRRMPVTFAAALVGGLSLAGIPPFAGAFAKDGVLDAARSHGGGLGWAVYLTGLVTAFVTAAYVTRFVVRTFLGERRDTSPVHESPLAMTGPLVLLSVAVLALGVPALPHRFGVVRWLGTRPFGSEPFHVSISGSVLATAIALVGIAVVALAHRRRPTEDPVWLLGRFVTPLRRAFYVDEFYDAAVVRPTYAVARAVVDVDRRGIGAGVDGAGRGARFAGGGLRLLQTGNVQLYATGVIVGVLVVVLTVSLAVG
jgi:NADH-quinone oxidoreductase subunit L